MKTTKIIATAGLSFLLLCSGLLTNCKKDATSDPEPEPVPLTNTQKLTGKNFKLVAMTINPGINTGTVTITDWYSQMDACEKDDLITFNSNGTYTQDEGVSKCNAADPQTTTGTWVWNSTETIITMTETGSTTPSSSNVLTNDGTNLKITSTENIGGTNYVITMTFVKQ